MLDTNILIWWISDLERVPQLTRRALEDPDNQLVVSLVSLWEIAIKMGKGKLTELGSSIHLVVDEMRSQSMDMLPVTLEHLYRLEYLSPHHNDPFDRILIAQALSENLTVATSDPIFRAYGVDLLS